MESLFLFWAGDASFDMRRFLTKTLEFPDYPVKIVTFGFSALFAMMLSYPFKVYLRNLVEKNVDDKFKDLFKDNYRRAHGYMHAEDEV